MAKSRLVKRYRRNKKRRNPAPEGGAGGGGSRRRNPPVWQDTLELVGPGFAAFAATRFITRVATTQIAKKWPKLAKHAGALASVGTFLGAWWLGNRVKLIEKYHSAVIAGAGIATGQSLVQIYLPRLGWVVADATPELDTGAETQQITSSSGGNSFDPALDSSFEILDEDGSWRKNNDASDSGRYANAPSAHQRQRPVQTPNDNSEDSAIFDMLETDDVDDMQTMGIFGG